MTANTSKECAVDDSVGWGPTAVAGDHDDREEHESKRIFSSLASGFESDAGPQSSQSIEHKPPTRPIVLL